MFSPAGVSFAARIATMIAMPVLILSAYNAPMDPYLDELVWLGGWGYFLSILALLGWPWRRSLDLISVLTVFIICLAVLRLLASGEPLLLLGLLTGCSGISLVYLPSLIERQRLLTRQYGNVSFDIIRIEERRRRRASRVAREKSAPLRLVHMPPAKANEGDAVRAAKR